MLLVSVAVTVLLMVLPLDRVAYPLLLLSTLVHELGHGVAALLVGGDFVQLRMFGDASGFAVTAVRPGAFQHALVSAGGLIGPAVAACLGFLLGRNPRTARIACLGLGVFGILATVLWIRGAAGLLTALLFTVLSFVAGLAKPAWMPQLWLVFAAVQLSLSVFTRGDYLFSDTASTGAGVQPSDAGQLADALIGPYWLWGAVCGLLSVLALLVGVVLYVMPARRRRGSRPAPGAA